MNKTVLIIIIVALVAVIGIIFLGGPKTDFLPNVEIKDGIQYVRVDARGGYFPKISNAQAGVPTKLIVKTFGTFDCSASLVIHSLNYRKILDQNAEEVIDLGTPKVGQLLQGVCGMGMHSFVINFS